MRLSVQRRLASTSIASPAMSQKIQFMGLYVIRFPIVGTNPLAIAMRNTQKIIACEKQLAVHFARIKRHIGRSDPIKSRARIGTDVAPYALDPILLRVTLIIAVTTDSQTAIGLTVHQDCIDRIHIEAEVIVRHGRVSFAKGEIINEMTTPVGGVVGVVVGTHFAKHLAVLLTQKSFYHVPIIQFLVGDSVQDRITLDPLCVKKFSKKIVDTPSVPLLALLQERLRGLRCGGPKTRLANGLSSGLRYLLCHAREQGAQGHKNR